MPISIMLYWVFTLIIWFRAVSELFEILNAYHSVLKVLQIHSGLHAVAKTVKWYIRSVLLLLGFAFMLSKHAFHRAISLTLKVLGLLLPYPLGHHTSLSVLQKNWLNLTRKYTSVHFRIHPAAAAAAISSHIFNKHQCRRSTGRHTCPCHNIAFIMFIRWYDFLASCTPTIRPILNSTSSAA